MNRTFDEPRWAWVASTLAFAALLMSMGGGCAVRAQHLRQLPLMHTDAVRPQRQVSDRFLVRPFADLRGDRHSGFSPTTFIPVVNLFHLGINHEYPEQSGLVTSTQGLRDVVSVGSLDAAFPHLLAGAMRAMHLTPNVTVTDDLNATVDCREFDYVIGGNIRRSHTYAHANLVPLTIPLAVFGVPFRFVTYHYVVEVFVARADEPTTPISERTYEYSALRPVGLYYNHTALYDMFVESLQQTLAQIVYDIGEAIAGARPSAARRPSRSDVMVARR